MRIRRDTAIAEICKGELIGVTETTITTSQLRYNDKGKPFPNMRERERDADGVRLQNVTGTVVEYPVVKEHFLLIRRNNFKVA